MTLPSTSLSVFHSHKSVGERGMRGWEGAWCLSSFRCASLASRHPDESDDDEDRHQAPTDVGERLIGFPILVVNVHGTRPPLIMVPRRARLASRSGIPDRAA